jgi:hypothetical protein
MARTPTSRHPTHPTTFTRAASFALLAPLALAALALAALALAAPARGAAPDNSAKDDLAQVQGVWERQAPTGVDLGYQRATKDIRGSRETVTFYAADGKVLRRHEVDFKVSRTGDVRVFTYSNMEVTEGDGKGTKTPQAFSYLYRVKGNQFWEAEGLLASDQDDQPSLQVWTKKATAAEAVPAGAEKKATPR